MYYTRTRIPNITILLHLVCSGRCVQLFRAVSIEKREHIEEGVFFHYYNYFLIKICERDQLRGGI